MTSDRTTIYALSSGAVRAGVAVIRMSGPKSSTILASLAGSLPAPRRAVLRQLVRPDTKEELDDALVLWFPAPASFSGEDMAEFHLHGGRATVEGCIDALTSFRGTRAAEPGEFTRRAFENGKIDLTQVEALADLIDAETGAQKRQALHVMRGSAGALFERWRATLVRCLAHLEAEIDFIDEEAVPDGLSRSVRQPIHATRMEIAEELARPNRGEIVRDGLQVAIAGAPNVGKSALLNALARRDVAIVSDAEGTTRDVLEVHLDLGGYPVVLADTAGLRDTGDAVEKEGIARAMRRMDEADLVLMVCDASGAVSSDAMARSNEMIRVWNKIDLVADNRPPHNGDMAVSALTGEGLDDLVATLKSRACGVLEGGEIAHITRQRHRQSLESCVIGLDRTLVALDSGLEFAAEDLRLAVRDLGRITGRVDVEDLLDVIFSDFCIGK